MRLGRYGVWAGESALDASAAAEIESLGYGAIWIGSSPGGDLSIVSQLLDATSTVVVATGIVNIWTDSPASVASAYHRIADQHPDRFLLGVGAGHPEATAAYEKPYDALVRYLDGLDEADVPVSARALAALGPRVLRLARDRTWGAHPYLVPPAHTRVAREELGPSALLAPEHKIVVLDDPDAARALGRTKVEKPYLGLTNYVSNLKRLGYSDEDVAGSGSDRLIDDLVAHGTAAEVASIVSKHLDAGADHVCVQVIERSPGEGILPSLRELAPALTAE